VCLVPVPGILDPLGPEGESIVTICILHYCIEARLYITNYCIIANLYVTQLY
jgi:hypothetical protein